MANQGTEIQWTWAPGYKGETWNPMTGCDRVSPGCAHCYALELASRLKGMGQKRYQRDGDPKTSGPGFAVTLHPDRLEEPLRWRKPRMVFVNSMSDLFHEAIPLSFVCQVFAVMAASPRHRFLVLTKRPEQMVDRLGRDWETGLTYTAQWFRDNVLATARHFGLEGDPGWPLPNVWLGVTIENRRFVDRADLLRVTPAAVRFISAEPLLGPLVPDADHCIDNEHEEYPVHDAPIHAWRPWSDGGDHRALDLTGIDWLITGGESGPKHRRFDPQWATDLRDICEQDAWEHEGREGFTAFFHKQNGGRTPKAGGRLLDGRTYDEFPQPQKAVTTGCPDSQRSSK